MSEFKVSQFTQCVQYSI